MLALVGATPAQAANDTKGEYKPLPSPVRILDTRLDDFGVKPCLSPEGQVLQVLGSIKNSPDGLTATDGVVVPVDAEAASVALNVTAVGATAPGWITVWSGSGAIPTASNLNFSTGQVVPNMVIARLNTDVDHVGEIKLAANTGCPNVVVDIVGWFTNAPLTATDPPVLGVDRPDAGGYRASTSPTPRIMDTRPGIVTPAGNKGCVAANTPKDLDVTNAGGVPATGVKAVALNVTVAEATGSGWLTVYPNGVASPPTASNLNFKAGQVVPNMVIVKVGTGDIVKFAAAGGGCPHVIVDVIGWFQTGTQEVGTFEGLTPARVLDTRAGAPGGAPPCVSQERKVQVAGVGGVPAVGDTKPPVAVALNVTAVDASFAGFATVWPSGTTKPWTSNLNYVAGAGAVPNMVISKVGADGKISLFANEGCPDMIVDVVGWWAAPEATLTATPASPVAFAVTGPDLDDTEVFTVTNNSAFNDTAVPAVTFAGTGAAEFTRPVGGSCSTTVPLAAGASCTLQVKWTPVGNDNATATMKITGGHDDTGDITLNGTYTPAP